MSFLGPLGISLAPQVAGYRQMGLKYDDLLVEENDTVQKAIGRLSPRESYDRIFRFRVASQQSILHRDLPKEQWVKAEEDVRYLKPHVEEAWKEELERSKWDRIEVQRKK